MEKKSSKPQVADNPIADVFENRHPSAAEKSWAEKTLAPTIEKAPEHPIGAPTGVNLDEHGHARFTTMQQDGVRRDQVTQVRGYADQLLRLKNNPYDPSNRRVSILVHNLDGTEPKLAPLKGLETKAGQ